MRLRLRALATLVMISSLAGTAVALPGDVLFSDDFEDGTLAPWTRSASTNPQLTDVGSHTAQSGTRSLFVRGDRIAAISPVIDASGIGGADLSVWIRRGSDSFSEDPEKADEDAVIQYLSSAPAWVTLEVFDGGGTPGETFSRTYSLPANALHAGFRIRVALLAGDACDNGSGPGAPCWDYYHFDDFRVVERSAPITANLVLEYRMEDAPWSGAAGEVTDESANGLDATTYGEPRQEAADPAVAGDPGTCAYAVFDGVDDFLEVADDPALDLPTALTASAWIRADRIPGSELMSILSKDENFEFHIDEDGEIFWWWGGGAQELTTTGANITPNQWHHVAVTYESGSQSIYVDGQRRASAAQTGALTTNADPFQVGQDQDYPGRFFAGRIDEVRVYDAAISQAQVQDLMIQTHPCPLFCGRDSVLSDGFEDGTLAPWQVEPGAQGNAGVSAAAASSGSSSLFLRHDTVAVRSPVVDLAAATSASLSLWVRRGDDSFSELPDAGEDLTLEYLDDTGGWVLLQTFPGSGTGGQVFEPSYALAADAFHAAFQIRARLLQGSGSDFDYWHIDDVCLTATIPSGLDHFVVGHDGTGIHCADETVTVTAVDVAGNTVTNYTGEIELDTGSGNGTWASGATNQGTFSDATPDDGLARYQFADADDGVATFQLSYPSGASPIDIDVVDVNDATARDDDIEGTLAWATAGFTVTASRLPNPPPSPIADPIANQVAGTDFALHLAAFGADCGIVESYTGTQSLAFWHGFGDPGSGTLVPTIDGNAIGATEAAATSQNVVFTDGQAVVTARYKDVGRIQISMKDSVGGSRGASNFFVVSPADFFITSIQRLDLSANPGIAVPTGEVFVAAGAPFRVTLEARDAEGDRTPNYGNEATPEGIVLTAPTLVAPAGGRNGSNDDGAIGNGTAFSAVAPAGTFRATTVWWDEVGAITLQASVADGSYLGAGDVTGSETGTVGRFRPDHFDVSLNAPTFDTSCPAGAFGYVGQPFGYMTGGAPVITATAQAVANSTTRNYAGTWFRLTNGSLANQAYAAFAGTLDTGGAPGTDPVILPGGDGTATLTFSSGSGFFFQRGATPVAPFDADIALSVDVIDLDGAAYTGNPARFGEATAGNGIPFDAGKQMRWGRLAFENAHGSEVVPLQVPLRAEYWLGAGYFGTNVADVCTTLAIGNLQTTPTPGSLVSTPSFANVPLASGDAGLSLSAPGAGNAGTIDLEQDLSNAGDDLGWLQFDWEQDGGHDENPTGRATFGVFSGDGSVIFHREIY